MLRRTLLLLLLAGSALPGADPAITIYNQSFCVVRETLPVSLKRGSNAIRYSGTAAYLEPESVVLRDPSGRAEFQILEQNFRSEPLSESLLLSLFEGKEIEFEADSKRVKGRIVRSGYIAPPRMFFQQNQYYRQPAPVGQPIIEVDGRLMFSLPGKPVFPALGDNPILNPTLLWTINSSQESKFDAEVSYVTSGITWRADYNLVSPEKGDSLDLAGWVTMDNRSGKDFTKAKIKLVAGDVNRIQPATRLNMESAASSMAVRTAEPQIQERNFDEYHLYTLPRATTLHNDETKQVEFLRSAGIASQRFYVYDGGATNMNRYPGLDATRLRMMPDVGAESNPKVWVMREFENTEKNGLGVALPKGRVRFYRRDKDGQLEFIGENTIDHTPRNEKVRVYIGNAFDIVGERKRSDFRTDSAGRWVDESFQITLRNRKPEPAQVIVKERLFRWTNWQIQEESIPHRKLDSQNIEFVVDLKANEERTLTYKAHYSW